MPSIVRITFVYLIASNNTAIYPIYATAVNRPFFLYLIIKYTNAINIRTPNIIIAKLYISVVMLDFIYLFAVTLYSTGNAPEFSIFSTYPASFTYDCNSACVFVFPPTDNCIEPFVISFSNCVERTVEPSIFIVTSLLSFSFSSLFSSFSSVVFSSLSSLFSSTFSGTLYSLLIFFNISFPSSLNSMFKYMLVPLSVLAYIVFTCFIFELSNKTFLSGSSIVKFPFA